MGMEYMSRYECSRIIGIRAAQLNMSAPVMVDTSSYPSDLKSNNMYIAARELNAGALDLKIRRPLPMNRYYEIHVQNLCMPDDLDAIISMYESRQYK